MAPRRKRQRLSLDGAEAVTATADAEPSSNAAKVTPKEVARRQLFVRGLAPNVTSEDLTEYFSESYPIKNALVVLDKETRESKSYGFVTFADVEDAQRAKEELNNTEIKGKKIKVDFAEARQREGEEKRPRAGDRAKAEREQQIKEAQTPKLIIRNLPWTIKTQEDLQKLFRSYGKVNFVNLPKKPNGELRGFGFVSLRGKKNAERAIQELNGKEIDERPIAVDWAVDRDTWQSGIQLDDNRPKREEYTLFVRNVPFTVDDERLKEHFQQFGGIRFARVVVDRETERPKGTGFVSFFTEEDMINCLKGVPRVKLQKKNLDKKDGSTITVTHSVLEDEDADPTGKYTIDGRILQISRAVDKNEATRLTAEGAASRFNRDKDKRRLYLLSEGTISSNSPLYQKLSPSEIKMREESATMRRKQIQENPSLHLSLTRLSVRNIPRSITSKDLKQLARSAVVGFAADVKEGKRQKLNKEEVIRGGQEMLVAEKMRKKKGKGIVKQAKVVYETPAGSKVSEDTGAGRSRGYGFIEYYTHRNALMGLRWLNGHAVDYKIKNDPSIKNNKKKAQEALEDKRKRLIVEFAIENANVVNRRSDREEKAREPPKPKGEADNVDDVEQGATKGRKRKRDSSAVGKTGRGKPDAKVRKEPENDSDPKENVLFKAF
ncbi:RNA-binding protein (RRM domain) [Pyrenophora tritici-repentis]|nr:RNA-binding protein RRM domain [Pyrenophora tritici-repentis]KAI1588488.1 RNA-binding protein RRM domain [Pyrenophora tritici-repentis]KAI1607106.1 RNA-binding protein RRM domain [Pyrenophora tritici-repentis]PZD35403.1 RNA-binding protein (RRM domain) [Pyrenophora tritici-repentis]PZD46181.1 RNA-binding protein (RRM domain) [Pyrenophora tritici-repentis]